MKQKVLEQFARTFELQNSEVVNGMLVGDGLIVGGPSDELRIIRWPRQLEQLRTPAEWWLRGASATFEAIKARYTRYRERARS